LEEAESGSKYNRNNQHPYTQSDW